MGEETLIGTKEAAAIMHYSEQWVRMLARANAIPSKKARPGGKKFIFKKEDIVKLSISGADGGGE